MYTMKSSLSLVAVNVCSKQKVKLYSLEISLALFSARWGTATLGFTVEVCCALMNTEYAY